VKDHVRSRLAWLLPFGIGGGMACGALLGWSFRSAALLLDGVSGHGAGALGALLVLLCLGIGSALSLVTVVVAKLCHRSAPGFLLIRLALGIAGGGLLGILGPGSRGAAVWASWTLLLGLPVLLSWSRRPRKARPGP
jgi:hypothetical protein